MTTLAHYEKTVADSLERFRRETADHTMAVLHDDGLYRHLRFSAPNNFYWFDIITWPGCLTIRGGAGGCHTLSRDSDMFAFFRRNGNTSGINPDYWAEKLAGGRDSVQKFSEEILRELLAEVMADYERDYPERAERYAKAKDEYDRAPMLGRYPFADTPREPGKLLTPDEVRELVDDYDRDGELAHEDGARRLLRELESAGVASDTWEWNLSDWDWAYLWLCHAIVWGIGQYDASKARAVEDAAVAA